MTDLKPEERARLHKALTEIQTIRQSIGTLGLKLRHTKPGSKKHKEYWAKLTELEIAANKHADTLRFFIQFGFCPEPL